MAKTERERLVAELTQVHRQMLERDAVFAHCEEELRRRDENLAATQRELADAGEHIKHLTREIEAMKATRAWRLAERIRAVRARVRAGRS